MKLITKETIFRLAAVQLVVGQVLGGWRGSFKRHIVHVKLHFVDGNNQQLQLLRKSASSIFELKCKFDLVP